MERTDARQSGQQSREERTQAAIARKTSMAAERNSRFLFVDTIDTQVILDLARGVNSNLKIIRSRMGADPRFPLSTVEPILDKYYTFCQEIDNFLKELSSLTGAKYRSPKVLDRRADAEDKESGKQDGNGRDLSAADKEQGSDSASETEAPEAGAPTSRTTRSRKSEK